MTYEQNYKKRLNPKGYHMTRIIILFRHLQVRYSEQW